MGKEVGGEKGKGRKGKDKVEIDREEEGKVRKERES